MNLEDKRIEWKARYDAWKESGISAAEWAREQGLKVHQMYYWIQKMESASLNAHQKHSETEWLAVNLNESSATPSGEPVMIHFESISVEVRSGTDMGLLSDVVQVLKSHDN